MSYDVKASGTIEIAQRHFQGLLTNIETVTSTTPPTDILKRLNLRQAKEQLQVLVAASHGLHFTLVEINLQFVRYK